MRLFTRKLELVSNILWVIVGRSCLSQWGKDSNGINGSFIYFVKNYVLIKDVSFTHFLELQSWKKLTNILGLQNAKTRILEDNLVHKRRASKKETLPVLGRSEQERYKTATRYSLRQLSHHLLDEYPSLWSESSTKLLVTSFPLQMPESSDSMYSLLSC